MIEGQRLRLGKVSVNRGRASWESDIASAPVTNLKGLTEDTTHKLRAFEPSRHGRNDFTLAKRNVKVQLAAIHPTGVNEILSTEVRAHTLEGALSKGRKAIRVGPRGEFGRLKR